MDDCVFKFHKRKNLPFKLTKSNQNCNKCSSEGASMSSSLMRRLKSARQKNRCNFLDAQAERDECDQFKSSTKCKSILKEPQGSLDTCSLEDLCDWLTIDYNMARGNNAKTTCGGEEDPLLTEIGSKLKQLQCLRRQYDHRTRSSRSVSTSSVKFKNAEPCRNFKKSKNVDPCRNFRPHSPPPSRKGLQPDPRVVRSTKESDVLGVYERAMSRVGSPTKRRNCSSLFPRSPTKVNASRERNVLSTYNDFKTSKCIDVTPSKATRPFSPLRPRGRSPLLDLSTDDESHGPCPPRLLNKRNTSRRRCSINFSDDVPVNPCKPPRKKSIAGGQRLKCGCPKRKCSLSSSDDSQRTGQIIKECKSLLHAPSELEMYGLTEEPVVMNVKCGQSRTCEEICEVNECGSLFEDDDEAWRQVKCGITEKDNFYDCLKSKIENMSSQGNSARGNFCASCGSDISLNCLSSHSSCTNTNNLSGNNTADHNNVDRANEGAFNILGYKLYSAIREKFKMITISSLAPPGDLKGELAQPQHETAINLDVLNNAGQKSNKVPTQQMNNSSNNHHTTLINQRPSTSSQNVGAETENKCDWRSKIEYWNITLEDVKEFTVSTPTEDFESGKAEAANVSKMATKNLFGNPLSIQRLRELYLFDVPVIDVDRTEVPVRDNSVKVVVNSNANADPKGPVTNFSGSEAPKKPQTSRKCRSRAPGNSARVKTRPPWKPINTSVPPAKRVSRPPVQQNFVVKDRLPIQNNPCYDAGQFIGEKDTSNNNCCYCCRQDCCCQQLLLQLQLHQHCRYLEEMLNRKQEELKTEMRQLHESSSTRRGNDLCFNPCFNPCYSVCSNACCPPVKPVQNNECPEQTETAVAPFRRCGQKEKNQSWWVDIDEKHKDLFKKSSSSIDEPCNFSKKFRSSKHKDKQSKCGGIGKLLRDFSSDSSCEQLCKDRNSKNVRGDFNQESKKVASSSSDKCSQTLADRNNYSSAGCQTSPRHDKPSLDKLKPSRSVQCDHQPETIGSYAEADDGKDCEAVFRDCMKLANEAALNVGPRESPLSKVSESLNHKFSDKPSESQSFFSRCKIMGLNAEGAEKLRDFQSIISAFVDRTDRSKRQFQDLKNVCRGQQLINLCLQSNQNKFQDHDISKICESQESDELSNLMNFLENMNKCYKKSDTSVPKKQSLASDCRSAANQRRETTCREDRKRKSWKKDASVKSSELVHRWMERCLKQKNSKSEKLFDGLRSKCEEDSCRLERKKNCEDNNTTSCDDANWECQLMTDNSLSPTSRKEQKRNLIFSAIEAYCKEFGSLVQTMDECAGIKHQKQKVSKELEKLRFCQCQDKKSSLKSPAGRDKQKKVKLSLEDVCETSHPRSSRQKPSVRDLSDSSNTCRNCNTASCSTLRATKSQSNSVVSCPESRRSGCADMWREASNRHKCERRELISRHRSCSTTSRESDRALTSSKVYKKLKGVQRCCCKKCRNRCQSKQCCRTSTPTEVVTESPCRSGISTGRQSCPTPSGRYPCKPSVSCNDIRACSSPRKISRLECSSNSRESVLTCLHEILTKRRLERAVKEECLKWDIRRSCQLERIEKCL